MPLVEARAEMDKIETGQTLEDIANCASAEEDMRRLTGLQIYEMVRTWKKDGSFHFLIKRL